MKPTATQKAWLTIVGIGEDGIAGLGADAQGAISTASYVFGGARHLKLASSLIRGSATRWPTPFSVDPVVALRGEPVCVLASGDPLFHGVGATLARHIAPHEMLVLSAPSALSLAAARLGWALQDIEAVSLHGHPIDLLRPLLHPHRRILALTSDGDAPAAIAAMLASNGFGRSRLTILEALGGEQEKRRDTIATGFDIRDINPLNVLAIEVEADSEARILPLSSGLADRLFDHDGQITKREVRAVTLSSLAPRRGELLWDIGAGSGSIGIEWALLGGRTCAVERRGDRAATIRANIAAFGLEGQVSLHEGDSLYVLPSLSAPEAVFVGGGFSRPLFDAIWSRLGPAARLVVNAVTLETEALLGGLHAEHGGTLLRIELAEATPLGPSRGWQPARPLVQWTVMR